MRSALLRGRDHVLLDAVEAQAEGPVAVALSRGGAAKTYGHQEPNEDAALFAIGDAGVLVAVADGHYGASGAEQALEALRSEAAPAWLGPEGPGDEAAWRGEIVGRFAEIDAAILLRARDAGLMAAPTTLSLVVARPAEQRFWHASVGDSHVFEVHREGAVARDLSARALLPGRPGYLGDGFASRAELADRVETGSARDTGLCAIALATDGLSEVGIGVADPASALVELATGPVSAEPGAALRPLALARGLVEIANAAHRRHRSGDNIASAVVWLED
ncbi:MAG: protein phosphatase 2C domain-containing protein [Myxococcota bacterium]